MTRSENGEFLSIKVRVNFFVVYSEETHTNVAVCYKTEGSR
jgi:hypothetical protein